MHELAKMKSHFKKHLKELFRTLANDGYEASLESDGNLRLRWKIFISISSEGISSEVTEDKSNGLLLFELFTRQGPLSEFQKQCGCALTKGANLNESVVEALTSVMNNNYQEIMPSQGFVRDVIKDLKNREVRISSAGKK